MAEPAGFLGVDWSKLPPPVDDGGARHLAGARLARVPLPSTRDDEVNLADLEGRTVVFAYPMTATPGLPLPDGWDGIPGARGCTPQACAFRDLHEELKRAGASAVFGLSTQTPAEQKEAAARLHLPFPLLSDDALALTLAMSLPTMEVEGKTMIRRLTLIVDDGAITHVFYPVFPPDRNAGDVLTWLAANPR